MARPKGQPAAAPAAAKVTDTAQLPPEPEKAAPKPQVDHWGQLCRAMNLHRKSIHTLNMKPEFRFCVLPKPDMTGAEAFILAALLSDQAPFLTPDVLNELKALKITRHIEMTDQTHKAAA